MKTVTLSVNMKRIIFYSVVLCLSTLSMWGQVGGGKICRTGVAYEISKSSHWGMGKPVVTSIMPYSPAEKSGLHLYDIIEEIDGIPVSELSGEEIGIMMNPAERSNIVLTVKSTASPVRQVSIFKECKPSNSIAEAQLAMAFNMYSLETTSIREFTCPFKITVTNDDIDFSNFKTFAFAPVDESNRELEKDINRIIEQELEGKGFEKKDGEADMLIQTFYYFDKNTKYVGPSPVKLKVPVYRYNTVRGKMEKLPFLDLSSSESEAPYLLQFGFRIIDQKVEKGRVLWECESNDMLEEAYRLEEYAQVHVPLMIQQFPYVKSKSNVVFRVTQSSYNYTGINYNMDKLSSVVSVDRNSPAYDAGIRARDVIEGIEGQSTDYSIDEFTSAYRQFITNTMKYRDPETKFTDGNGFRSCMYWDTFKYPEVSKAIQNPNNLTAFAYLYYFTPYVNPTSNNTITFYVKQGYDRKKIVLRPTIRTSTIIEIK